MVAASPEPFGRVVSRVRMPLVAATAAALVASWLVDLPTWWSVGAIALFALAMACYVRVGTPVAPPLGLTSPVRGRWLALNSPTSRVPSHGVHAWSQTYACDLVHDPEDGTRPSSGWWPVARRPEEFPGFGQPVASPVDGTVVRVVDVMRDHWSRSSPLGVVWFLLEGVRELLGPAGVLGNHVGVRTDEGTVVLLAHLRRRSVTVARGDRVSAGDVVGECGNSGNSTEPHLHLQAMDRSSPWVAAGMPFTLDGSPVPPNGSSLGAAPPGG